ACEVLGASVESLRNILRAIERDGVEDEAAEPIDSPADVPGYFVAEAADHLDTIAIALRAIAGPEPDREAVSAVLRALHTLKGAADTIGCHSVAVSAHRLETLLIDLRDGRVSDGPAAIATIEAGVATLRGLLSPVLPPPERTPREAGPSQD